MGTDWRENDLKAEPIVDSFQGHRQSYEHLGAPRVARRPGELIGGWKWQDEEKRGPGLSWYYVRVIQEDGGPRWPVRSLIPAPGTSRPAPGDRS